MFPLGRSESTVWRAVGKYRLESNPFNICRGRMGELSENVRTVMESLCALESSWDFRGAIDEGKKIFQRRLLVDWGGICFD